MEKEEDRRKIGKLLKSKIDVVFHALFREENKDLLGELITDVMLKKKIDIKNIEEKTSLGVEEIKALIDNK